MPKLDRYKIFEFNIPFCRDFLWGFRKYKYYCSLSNNLLDAVFEL